MWNTNIPYIVVEVAANRGFDWMTFFIMLATIASAAFAFFMMKYTNKMNVLNERIVKIEERRFCSENEIQIQLDFVISEMEFREVTDTVGELILKSQYIIKNIGKVKADNIVIHEIDEAKDNPVFQSKIKLGPGKEETFYIEDTIALGKSTRLKSFNTSWSNNKSSFNNKRFLKGNIQVLSEEYKKLANDGVTIYCDGISKHIFLSYENKIKGFRLDYRFLKNEKSNDELTTSEVSKKFIELVKLRTQ
ncbi:MAG: hypothetical protein A2Y33_14015 [Spirochaetes bacterium GWF1_51_8]|nr:MAG: hypothetical protein A2Y33_14015 [Spirochaetes bacterium GWF1_51_8]